jgi:hypothetical protein
VKNDTDCPILDLEQKKYLDSNPSPTLEPGAQEKLRKINTSSENTTPEMKNKNRKPSDKAVKLIGKRLKASAF